MLIRLLVFDKMCMRRLKRPWNMKGLVVVCVGGGGGGIERAHESRQGKRCCFAVSVMCMLLISLFLCVFCFLLTEFDFS